MSAFLNVILPSCCTRRDAKKENYTINSRDCYEISKLDIESESSEKIIGNLFYRQSKYFDGPEDSLIRITQQLNPENELVIESPESNYKLIGESTSESTRSIENANQILEQFQCSMCNQSSQGFCIGCQNLRYCKDCYEKAHEIKFESHKFCIYARKTFKTTSNALRALARLKK
ncbi:unnamed protein product [Blepharisma stoltei]|uniref:Uncharacterized protein n=1 Tax=Blepharisma stoltei TaxID=1481888 RepID=A0AAU9K1K8_9CILI|nr:unnamed protein product [Blepharisma stoltei]